MKKVRRELIIAAALVLGILLLVPFVSTSTPLISSFDLLTNFLSDEKSYLEYMTETAHFKDISFQKITINKGDNFWKIARDNNINIDTMIGCNPFWDDLLARIDQEILIPSEKGIVHFIDDIDDINALGELYDVDPQNIVMEELPPLYALARHYFGKKKFIVCFVRDVDPKPDNMTASLGEQFRIREMFRSPLGGRYSSFFGMRKHPIFRKRRFHNGVDIAARYGTLVGASRAGVVVSTGWMGGYGKAVIIQHDNGYRTLYGHLSRILTRKGKKVKTGSIIGRVGSTGWSTGPHLHFTLWQGKRLINPLSVLW